MAEYKLPTAGNCDVLIYLVREYGQTMEACLDVAMIIDEIEIVKFLLAQKCPVCYVEYTRDEVSLIKVKLIHFNRSSM